MMASRKHGPLCVGVTSDLLSRVTQHREGSKPGFALGHAVKRLVWYEWHEQITVAIHPEKTAEEVQARVEDQPDRTG